MPYQFKLCCNRFNPLLLAAFFVALQLVLPAIAKAASPTLIYDIQVEGLELIDKGTIYGSIQSRIGGPLSAAQVTADIKSLFELGFFANVQARVETQTPEETVLIFVIKEKPRIKTFSIEGNHHLDKKKFEEDLRVFEKNMIDTSRVKSDVAMIKGKYREDGFYSTQVDYDIVPAGDGWVNLTYRINEKPKVYITEIRVKGTQFYYPLDIERIMQSAEVDCFAWINDSGVFMEDKVNADLQMISQQYMTEGFIKVNVKKPKITIIRSKDFYKLVIDLEIVEGDRYFTRDIKIESEDGYDLLFAPETRIPELKLQKGDPFNPFKQNQDQFDMMQVYLEQGYAFANIRPLPKLDEETKEVDVLFLVSRRHKAYIGRVDVQGNYETQDYVIRRELQIHDNELFNGVKLRDSQAEIGRLGFFEPGTGIQFNRNPGSNEHEIDYELQLQETQTGSFSASLAYSALNGAALQLKLTKRNLFGTGKSLSFSVNKEQNGDSLYDLGLVNPYWLDTQGTQSINIFNQLKQYTEYQTKAFGANMGYSYPLWKHLYLLTKYSVVSEEYLNVISSNESLFGRDQNLYRSLKLGLSYNTVNNPMFPSTGYELRAETERFGGPFGGSIDYQSNSYSYSHFAPFNEAETIVGMLKLRMGQLIQTNPDELIPLHNRFRLGGSYDIRGHDPQRILGPSSYLYENEYFTGADVYPVQSDYSECDVKKKNRPASCPNNFDDLPTDKSEDRLYWDRHIGGNEYRLANLEMLFPLTREGRNIRGVVFYDIGNTWAEQKMYDLRGVTKSYSNTREAAGVGVRLITPMGVIRFEYGIKLDATSREKPGRFDFSISG